MQVRIEAQVGGEPLDLGHRAAPGVGDASLAGAPSLPGGQRADERAVALQEQGVVVGDEQAEVPGQGQDPLADRGPREDPVHEVGREVRHPPASARRTCRAPAAAEADEAGAAAASAPEAPETSRKHATADEGAELSDDEVRKRAALPMQMGDKGLEVGPDDLVQDRPLGVAAAVAGALGREGGAGGGEGRGREAHRALGRKAGAGRPAGGPGRR